MIRLGLAAMLATDRGLQWAGEAASGADALRDAPERAPDVVLVGLELPQPDGLATVAALRALLPRARFLVLGRQPDTLAMRRVTDAGACACVAKNVSSEQLAAAVRGAHLGWPDAAAAAGAPVPRHEPGADLTQRERELLALMARGLSNHDIAARLSIAMPTVKFHVTNILAKLQAENRTEAVLIALRQGLVALE